MMRSISTAAATFAAVLGLVSCSGNSSQDMQVSRTENLRLGAPSRVAPVLTSQSLSSRAGLPSPSSLRSSSAIVQYSQLGSEYNASIPGATVDGSSLALASAAGQYSWGIWQFGFAQDATGCVVTTALDSGEEVWCAVSDFVTNSWAIYGPITDSVTNLDLSVRDFARPGNGDLFIAVLSYDGDSIGVESLDLILDVTGGARDVDASGGYTSMVLVEGRPAIAYYEQENDDLRYVRAGDPFGQTWGPSQIVDAEGDTGLFASMLVIDGNPAIAYHNTTDNELRYVRATDAIGDNWGAPKILAGSGADSDGEYCCLAVVNGQPAVAFYDEGNGSLRYVRSSDAQGGSWPASVQLDANNNCGQYPSLAEVSGAPAIAYEAGGSADLRFIRAMDADGSTWALPQDLDTEHNAGLHNTLLMVNGRPAISFYDSSDSALRYMRSNDATGSSWPAAITLDGLDDDRGSFCSMQLVDGVPAISYHSGLWGDLRYISALDVDGASWGTGVILDESAVLTGKYTSLAVVAGHPAVSYFDQTNGKLRYIWGF